MIIKLLSYGRLRFIFKLEKNVILKFIFTINISMNFALVYFKIVFEIFLIAMNVVVEF